MTLAGTLAVGWGVTTWRNDCARRRRRHERRERYLEGVRFLLDDKPDRALEVFLSLAELDDETVDTHFALGSLYRRRGEVDRAIRVHQHIVARTGLDRAASRRGADRTRARLFPRRTVRPRRAAVPRAGRQRARSGDWRCATWCASTKCSTTGRRPPRRTNDCARSACPSSPRPIAHYYCELAEAAIARAGLRRRRCEHLRSARARAARLRPRRDPARRPRAAAGRSGARRCGCISASCGAISTCSRWCCRGSPMRRSRRAIRTQFDATLEELMRSGAGNPRRDRLCGDRQRLLRRSA